MKDEIKWYEIVSHMIEYLGLKSMQNIYCVYLMISWLYKFIFKQIQCKFNSKLFQLIPYLVQWCKKNRIPFHEKQNIYKI